ncbi:unnamed protein product [Ranitomeya imitator]|uniref:Dedicator of cytokinesis TPR repeats region domain-containing protein n=1 Tax=Ranitomeya imitator TaxID=111125 RepID=A0ABN9LN28_9NEOB|nr:unnamed protein product [Ranitomeya imitator]
MIGPFLGVSLVPQPEVRNIMIPIFHDMMDCEQRRNGNFKQVEAELIDKLDSLVSEGKGDENYRELFSLLLLEKIEQETWREPGASFVTSVTRLMERLLDYRDCMKGEETENKKIGCTVNLMNFYKSEINKEEMYIRYIHKLCDLHLQADSYTEAAFTLLLYWETLQWDDRSLREFLHLSHPERCWEFGIPLCRELAAQYEKLYDYQSLSWILKMEASYYDHIMDQQRLEPEFFRVGFYGKKFPFFLRISTSRGLMPSPGRGFFSPASLPSIGPLDDPHTALKIKLTAYICPTLLGLLFPNHHHSLRLLTLQEKVVSSSPGPSTVPKLLTFSQFPSSEEDLGSDIDFQSGSDSDSDQTSGIQAIVDSLILAISQTLKLKQDEVPSQDPSVSCKRVKRPRSFPNHEEFESTLSKHWEHPEKRFPGRKNTRTYYTRLVLTFLPNGQKSLKVDPPVSRFSSKTVLSLPDGASLKDATDRQIETLAKSAFEASGASLCPSFASTWVAKAIFAWAKILRRGILASASPQELADLADQIGHAGKKRFGCLLGCSGLFR